MTPLQRRWMIHAVVLVALALLGGLVAAFESAHASPGASGLSTLLTRTYFVAFALAAVGTTLLMPFYPRSTEWPAFVYVGGIPVILGVAFWIGLGPTISFTSVEDRDRMRAAEAAGCMRLARWWTNPAAGGTVEFHARVQTPHERLVRMQVAGYTPQGVPVLWNGSEGEPNHAPDAYVAFPILPHGTGDMSLVLRRLRSGGASTYVVKFVCGNYAIVYDADTRQERFDGGFTLQRPLPPPQSSSTRDGADEPRDRARGGAALSYSSAPLVESGVDSDRRMN